ncbi:E3 ubiquitin-protein ligase RLIM-like [Desmodus rotundus]|uniref:E3 ubiquitin-protein ligase RLIM-like n=1 Tax=Desmodus rotundus TaxID=9430 RepID=UPI0039E5051E
MASPEAAELQQREKQKWRRIRLSRNLTGKQKVLVCVSTPLCKGQIIFHLFIRMENADSGGEGDESEAQGRSQMDQVVQEEDFYPFVNNLDEDDYKPMRDNNLLGNPGEGDGSDDASSSDSLLDWLMSLEPTENVTTGQREQPPRREVSQVNLPSDFRPSSEINANFHNRGPNAREAYTPSTRLPTGGNMKNGQRQVECPQSEPRFARPPRSEQSRTGALLEVPPTRGQKRERSRGPDHSRTRARFESTRSPAESRGELLPRLHHSASSPTFEQPVVRETERFSRTQHHETLRQQITARMPYKENLLQTQPVMVNLVTGDR